VARPKEFELSFGVKLNAEAGVVFSKMGSEGSFQITLRWK
jgi:Trypsin-co-occurring domain 1